MLLSEIQIYFSYWQFLVFDKDIKLPGLDWIEEHCEQGFTRQDSSVSFATLLQFGDATVQIFNDTYVYDENDERVIKIPFYCPSGQFLIEGPEGNSRDVTSIEPGHYQLTCTQQADYENETELIRLYFYKVEVPAVKSEIIKCDDQLQPPEKLLETAEVAIF